MIVAVYVFLRNYKNLSKDEIIRWFDVNGKMLLSYINDNYGENLGMKFKNIINHTCENDIFTHKVFVANFSGFSRWIFTN